LGLLEENIGFKLSGFRSHLLPFAQQELRLIGADEGFTDEKEVGK
jgi:hypothetical protein